MRHWRQLDRFRTCTGAVLLSSHEPVQHEKKNITKWNFAMNELIKLRFSVH